MGIRNSSRYCTPGDADASAIRLNASGPSGDAAAAPWHVKKHSLRAERNTVADKLLLLKRGGRS